MKNFTLITALLCSFIWISVSLSKFHFVEVQPGGEVTLMCSNFSRLPSHITWFKLEDRPNTTRICSMYLSDGIVSFHDGFKKGKFNMISNTTTIFFKIKQVDISDSGLYFCGYYCQEKSVIVSATHVKVPEVFNGISNMTSVILGALTAFLIMVVTGIAVIIHKLQTADNEEQDPQRNENLASDDLRVAALSLHSAVIRSRRPASEREVETCVVYDACRYTRGDN